MVLTSHDMIHGPGGPKYNHKKPEGSESDCFMLIPKNICPDSNLQEPRGSKYDCLTLVLKKISHIHTHKNILEQLVNNPHDTYTMQNCNGIYKKTYTRPKILLH